MAKLYLVPRYINDTQIEKIFGDSLHYIQNHNHRDRLIVLRKPATEQQNAIMQIIYNS